MVEVSMLAPAPDVPPLVPPCPVTLLYIHGEDATPTLDGRVAAVVDRYAPMVELVSVTAAEVGDQYGEIAGCAPAVVLLRGGQVVGEAMGATLPSRELDMVVRCAVLWPAPA
jgi:hypothetical protein